MEKEIEKIKQAMFKLFYIGKSPINLKMNFEDKSIYTIAFGEFTSQEIETVRIVRDNLIYEVTNDFKEMPDKESPFHIGIWDDE